MSLLEKDNRKFSVIIGSKKCGACSGASPSGAARKIKGKRSEFYLKETTKGSKKKLYGPYSSKKKVVQRGGLRAELCQNLINFFLECPAYQKKKIDDGYKSIENAFRLLGISNYDPNRYIKLKSLIFLRTKYDRAIPFCQLLCSNHLSQILNDTDIQEILDNETKFIEHLKTDHYTKISEINIDGLNIDRWRAFILHFNEQLKYMEIRNHICLGVLDVLDNCDRQSHPAHFHKLLPELYKILLISQRPNPCDILKGILKIRENYKLRSGQTVNLLDVLFNIDVNFEIETLFISDNFKSINKLLSYSSLSTEQLTKMWHGVIKYIREFINYLVKERIEGITASEKISQKNYENMLRNLEQAKKKEMNNQNFLNKIRKELEEAKASFPQNSLEQLNTGNGNSNLHQSFLFSSQRNGKKPSIPSYLLMSTINSQQNRGFVRGGPAEESLNNRGNPAEIGPEQEQTQSFRSPLLEIRHKGQREQPQKKHTNLPPTSILNNPLLGITHRGRRNINPNQPPHNNQNPQPQMSNLEARLAALKND